MCASKALFMCFASRICLVVVGPYMYMSASPQASFRPLSSMTLPVALSAAITVCISPSPSTHFPLQSSLLISSCLAFPYKAMSKVITVFLSGHTTMQLICCVCFKTVNSVCHSWAGDAIKGSAATSVKGFAEARSEL